MYTLKKFNGIWVATHGNTIYMSSDFQGTLDYLRSVGF